MLIHSSQPAGQLIQLYSTSIVTCHVVALRTSYYQATTTSTTIATAKLHFHDKFAPESWCQRSEILNDKLSALSIQGPKPIFIVLFSVKAL